MFKHLKGDFFGGITAGIVALPLALAFGVSSGLGPSAGLYGAIFISFFAALFGGTNTQISGPTAPMTAVSMIAIASIIALNDGDISKALPIILTVFLLSGLMQIALGGLGLGTYIKYIPYPVVSGFMTAIGIIILVTQILPAVGYYPNEDLEYVSQYKPAAKEKILKTYLSDNKADGFLTSEDFAQTIVKAETITEATVLKEAKTIASNNSSGVIGTFKVLGRALNNINWLEFALALATILIIYGFKRITTAIPSTLVALVVITGIAYGFGLNYRPIQEIPGGLPIPNFKIFTGFKIGAILPYFFTALTLALLGAIDSLLTSVIADNMTQTKHKPNKELVGQGIGNSIAALFGGIPGAGATIRTVINIKSGGKTRISGMIAAILLLIILLALGPVASQIPAAVLAGILITVGIGVMDYKGLKAIPYLPKDIKLGPLKLSSEVIIMVLVFVLSSTWNLVYAVGIGLIFASLLFMKKIGDLTAERSNIAPLEEVPWADEKDFPSKLKEEVFIKHVNGPLFFGSNNEFQILADQIPDTANTVIIRMDKMHYMDQSGLYTMEEIVQELKKNTITVLLVDVQNQPRLMMEKIDIIPDLIPQENIFKNFDACLNWVKENIKDEV